MPETPTPRMSGSKADRRVAVVVAGWPVRVQRFAAR